MPGSKVSDHAVVTNGSQTHRSNATAPLANWVPAKLARGDACTEIGRDGVCRSRKDTSLRILGRRFHLPNERFRHVQRRILQPQLSQVGNRRSPLRRRQYLWICGAALRSKDAEPDLRNLRLICPEAEELVEVARAFCCLCRDRAVNGYSRPSYVLQDTVIGRWIAPCVVFRLQAVH